MKFSKIVKKHFSQHSFASKEKLFFYLSLCSCLIDYFSFSFHFTSFCFSPPTPHHHHHPTRYAAVEGSECVVSVACGANTGVKPIWFVCV